MTMLNYSDVKALADAWAHLPEGAAGTPLLHVPMTPRAALWMMDAGGMSTLEAELGPARVPLTVADLMPDPAPDAGSTRSGRPEPSVVVREGF